MLCVHEIRHQKYIYIYCQLLYDYPIESIIAKGREVYLANNHIYRVIEVDTFIRLKV